MIGDFGFFFLLIALIAAVIQAVVPLIGSYSSQSPHGTAAMLVARRSALIGWIFATAAFICLVWAFVINDFSLRYVASHSNSQLPLHYRVSAVWGAHEGSLLLWIMILASWTLAVARYSKTLPLQFVARVLAVLGFVQIGFLLFTILTSNPFESLLPNIALEGADLNPLLQDFGLIVHPPLLYMGYVGFSVVFAFAIAALLSGEIEQAWSRWARPWTLAAWMFLSIGIALGSWWAYYELGWGGWWFWDPVENASFMPWLAGAALVHSLAATDQRGVFKSWTLLLAITTFSLSLLGTFLVRSGVLTSVHSFAADPERGLFILIFLVIVIGVSLLLFALRAGRLNSNTDYQILSRETFLLANNIFLSVATFMVLLGTLYPVISPLFGGDEVSVGPPYFNPMFAAITLPMLAFLGLGQRLQWRHHRKPVTRTTLLGLAMSVLAAVLIVTLVDGWQHWQLLVGLALASWVMWHLTLDFKHKHSNAEAVKRRVRKGSLAYYGMTLAHLGLLVSLLGVIFVSAFSVEKDLRLETGETVSVYDYQFTLERHDIIRGPNYLADQLTINVATEQQPIGSLLPQKRRYNASGQIMTEAAIDAGLMRDLYVAIGENIGDGAWAVRIYVKPWIRWIWLGALMMALGALLAAFDRRYRNKSTIASNSDEVPVAAREFQP